VPCEKVCSPTFTLIPAANSLYLFIYLFSRHLSGERSPPHHLGFSPLLSLCFPRHQLNKNFFLSGRFLLGGDSLAPTWRHPISKNAAEIGFGQGCM
jgi:hypothetical protein